MKGDQQLTKFYIPLIRVDYVCISCTPIITLQYVVVALLTLSHHTAWKYSLVLCRMERSLRNCETTAESWGQRHSK